MVIFFTYVSSEDQLLDSVTTELRSIVQSTAPLIDSEAHENISYDAKSGLKGKPDFVSIQQQLIMVRDSNNMPYEEGLSSIYTLRPRDGFEQNRTFEFVVMTNKNSDGKYFTGAPFPAQNFQFSALKGAVNVSEIYQNGNGAWMSAVAPIFNADKKVVAILQTDRRVDYIYALIGLLKKQYFMAGVSSLIIGILLSLLFAHRITTLIKQLTESTKAFGSGDSNCRINQQRSDEFGVLFTSFNQMVDNLAYTEQKLLSANHDSEQAKNLAESASKAKSEFLAVMSHEIRTPMNGILGMVQILERTDLNNRQQRYVETLHRSSDALLVILNDILDFSKIDARKLSLDPTNFDLEKSCLDVIELLLPRAIESNIQLYFRFATSCPRMVFGDAQRMRQVLLNMVGNALKFTHEGYVFVDIDAKTNPGSENFQLMVSISDTGIGISKEQQEKLFEAFVQTDSSMSRKYGGTGLGLVISEKIIALMNGQLGVFSTEGVGSNFWYTLNLKQVKSKPAFAKTFGTSVLILENDPVYYEILDESFEWLGLKSYSAQYQ
jgi:signal transduction histidine kinase